MPTYEYECAKCGGVFEKFQSMTEPALTMCPKDLCARPRWGKGKVQRVIGGGAGLIFKGSGFYITDYRSENYKQAAQKDKAPTGTGGAKEGSSASGSNSKESKPAAAKTEKKTKTSGSDS